MDRSNAKNTIRNHGNLKRVLKSSTSKSIPGKTAGSNAPETPMICYPNRRPKGAKQIAIPSLVEEIFRRPTDNNSGQEIEKMTEVGKQERVSSTPFSFF